MANDVALPVLPQLHTIVRVLDHERNAAAIVRMVKLDVDDAGLADWIVIEDLRMLERAALALHADDHHNDEARADMPGPRPELLRAQVGLGFDWIARVAANPGVKWRWGETVLARLVAADLVSSAGPVVRAARALSAEDASLHFALALVLLSDGASGLQRASELLNGMHAEGEHDPLLLAKLSLRAGFALQGLELDEPMEDAVHSLLQWMLDRHNDFEPFVLLGISEHDFSTLITSTQGPAKASIEELRVQMRFSSAHAPAAATPDVLASVALSQGTLGLGGSPRLTSLSRRRSLHRRVPVPLLRCDLATVFPPTALLGALQVFMLRRRSRGIPRLPQGSIFSSTGPTARQLAM